MPASIAGGGASRFSTRRWYELRGCWCGVFLSNVQAYRNNAARPAYALRRPRGVIATKRASSRNLMSTTGSEHFGGGRSDFGPRWRRTRLCAGMFAACVLHNCRPGSTTASWLRSDGRAIDSDTCFVYTSSSCFAVLNRYSTLHCATSGISVLPAVLCRFGLSLRPSAGAPARYPLCVDSTRCCSCSS